MPKDYVPANDAQLHAFAAAFCRELSVHLAVVGLTPEEVAPVAAAVAGFADALARQAATARR